MAERIEVELVDDIDGSPAQHTITFALDGVHYEIDLNKHHAQQLRSVLAPYLEKARTAEKTDKPRTSKQREREERRQRQENKQLTEQIRIQRHVAATDELEIPRMRVTNGPVGVGMGDGYPPPPRPPRCP